MIEPWITEIGTQSADYSGQNLYFSLPGQQEEPDHTDSEQRVEVQYQYKN